MQKQKHNVEMKSHFDTGPRAFKVVWDSCRYLCGLKYIIIKILSPV